MNVVQTVAYDLATSAQSDLEFRILGPLEVRRGERALPLGSPKQRALLALLLLHANETISRDRLIEELWGDAAPNTVNAALNGYLTKLRRLLANGDTPLATQAPGYVLRVVVDGVDAVRFERLVEEGRGALTNGDAARAAALLREGLGLWRGPPLADLADERFAQNEIRRLDELRAVCLEERIEADLALGRHDTLVAELDALVREHPYRERLRAQLMLALYRCGRQAEALAAYQAARRTLVEELGLEPGSQLQKLERAILAHDRSLDAPRTEERRPLRNRKLIAAAAVLVLALALAVTLALVAWNGDAATSVVLAGNSVAVIDPAGNSVVDEIPVGGIPAGLAVGKGSVWVGNQDARTLLRIDPGSRRVTAKIDLGAEPLVVAAGEEGVWALDRQVTSVRRIDPTNNVVVATIPLHGRRFAASFATPNLVVGGGAAWIAHGGTLTRIDPATNDATVVRRSGVTSIDYGEDSLWLLTGPGNDQIERLDPATNRVIQRFPPARLGPTSWGLNGIKVGAGALWAVPGGVEVSGAFRLDPDTGNVLDSVAFGCCAINFVVGAEAIWVPRQDETLVRVDATSGRVVKRFPLGVPVSYEKAGFSFVRLGEVAAGEGAVWVGTSRN